MPEKIPYLDLKKINDRIHDEIIARLDSVLTNGRYIQGQWCGVFEKNFANFCGTKYAIGVGNGLDALRILLQAAGLGDGDEVIVPANTFIATILAIIQAGCKPVLVEPDIHTFNIDPEKVEAAITPNTKAIMAVHLYGRVAPMQELRRIADRYGLRLFEDAAQAHGAMLEGKRAGNLSDAAGFSFYPGKNLGALGDGGMITTNDAELYGKLKKIANYGSSEKYRHEMRGCNSRLDEFQAAVLDLKLETLDADNERRREIAAFYQQNITDKLIKPGHPKNPHEHVWHIYAARVPWDVEKAGEFMTPMREILGNALLAKGIETLVHYPIPPHRQQALSEFCHLSFPLTELIHREEISLPLNPVMTDDEVERVVEAVNGCF